MVKKIIKPKVLVMVLILVNTEDGVQLVYFQLINSKKLLANLQSPFSSAEK